MLTTNLPPRNILSIKVPEDSWKNLYYYSTFFYKDKGPRIDDTILKDHNVNQELMLPNFMTDYKVAVIKTACYRYKDR